MKKQSGFWKIRLVYGSGDFYGGAAAGIVGLLLLFFLTDVAGVSPMYAGVVVFCGRLVDGAIDPFLGAMGDRFQTRLGRRVPYFLFGAIPAGLSFVLIWLVPPLSGGALVAYYIATYVLFTASFSVVMVPYAALAPELTTDPGRRSSLISTRMAFSIIGGILAAVIPSALIASKSTEREGYALMSVVFGIVFVLIWLLMFAVMKGREIAPAAGEEKTPIKQALVQCFKNRSFVSLMLIYLFAFIPNDIISANLKYFLNYYLEKEGLFTPVIGVTMVMAVLSLPGYVFLIKRVGKPRAMVYGSLLRVVFLLLFMLLDKNSPTWLIMVLAVGNGIGTGASYAIPWALLPEVTDEDETLHGGRNEGIFAGVMTFMRTFSSSVAMLLLGFILEFSGYNAEAPVQAAGAVSAIRYTTILLPAALTAFVAFVAARFPITPERAQKIRTLVDVGRARDKAAAWLEGMRLEKETFTNSTYNLPVQIEGMTLPATYNALHTLQLMGQGDSVDKDAVAGFFAGFQTGSGAYRIPEMKQEELFYPSFEYDDFHITNYVHGALASFGLPHSKPFAFLKDYDTMEKLEAWLAKRDFANPWTEGNYIVNLASFYLYEIQQGNQSFQPLFDRLLQWHCENQSETGYFHDTRTSDLVSAMAGAAHNFHLFYWANRPIPRYKAIIDHMLSIPNEVSTACIDIDIVDILAHFYAYGYRAEEIKAYLHKKLSDLLAFQNEDGGFADATSGVRLFDGWGEYQEPQGLSNCFATWFRMASIGMAEVILYPENAHKWQFRNTIGIGYFNPGYLAGGFEEPEELPAVNYGPATDPQPAAEAACSEALLQAMEVITKKLSGKELGFTSCILVPDEGAFCVDAGGQVQPLMPGDADVTLNLSLATLNAILAGKLNPTAAYAMRKLKITGSMAYALKLSALL